MKETQRYQLRNCAGKHWLLDMWQEDNSYKAPIAINETGALIISTYLDTEDIDKTAKMLQEAYEIEWEEALQDVQDFLRQLHL